MGTRYEWEHPRPPHPAQDHAAKCLFSEVLNGSLSFSTTPSVASTELSSAPRGGGLLTFSQQLNTYATPPPSPPPSNVSAHPSHVPKREPSAPPTQNRATPSPPSLRYHHDHGTSSLRLTTQRGRVLRRSSSSRSVGSGSFDTLTLTREDQGSHRWYVFPVPTIAQFKAAEEANWKEAAQEPFPELLLLHSSGRTELQQTLHRATSAKGYQAAQSFTKTRHQHLEMPQAHQPLPP